MSIHLTMVLRAWEFASRTAPEGIEPSVLVVADDSDTGLTVASYAEMEGEDTLLKMAYHLSGHLAADGIAPRWVGHCAPVFYLSVDPTREAMPDEDLAVLAQQGDERVRELVAVTVVYPNGKTVSQSYVPPLNEPLSDEPNTEVSGHIVDVLSRLAVPR